MLPSQPTMSPSQSTSDPDQQTLQQELVNAITNPKRPRSSSLNGLPSEPNPKKPRYSHPPMSPPTHSFLHSTPEPEPSSLPHPLPSPPSKQPPKSAPPHIRTKRRLPSAPNSPSPLPPTPLPYHPQSPPSRPRRKKYTIAFQSASRILREFETLAEEFFGEIEELPLMQGMWEEVVGVKEEVGEFLKIGSDRFFAKELRGEEELTEEDVEMVRREVSVWKERLEGVGEKARRVCEGAGMLQAGGVTTSHVFTGNGVDLIDTENVNSFPSELE
ncbi:hypothetical protein K440DRAFT_666961 [Wilcoxina mikolae CBS 423.85]|nr:hypothetical protein K440DRAFT_666961 [Wilcoxina mikolae CBS 423.85]